MGRKIPSRKKQGPDARQVASSKHRSALLKKFSEVSALCSVENALVILSPDGKAFSFGRSGPKRPGSDSSRCPPTDNDATLRELNKQYADVLEQLEAEKKKSEKLEEKRRERLRQSQGQSISLIDRPVDELNLEELATLKSMMEELRDKLKKHLQELPVEPAAQTLLAAEETGASSSAMVGDGVPADHGP